MHIMIEKLYQESDYMLKSPGNSTITHYVFKDIETLDIAKSWECIPLWSRLKLGPSRSISATKHQNDSDSSSITNKMGERRSLMPCKRQSKDIRCPKRKHSTHKSEVSRVHKAKVGSTICLPRKYDTRMDTKNCFPLIHFTPQTNSHKLQQYLE